MFERAANSASRHQPPRGSRQSGRSVVQCLHLRTTNKLKPVNDDVLYRVIEGPDSFRGARTEGLYRLWSALKGDRQIPLASQFDYLDCPELIPTMVVIDHAPKTDDYVTAFYGAELAQFFGLSAQSVTWSTVVEEREGEEGVDVFVENSRRILDLTREARKPVLNGPKHMEWGPKSWVWFESLCTPFVDPQGEINKLVCILDAEPDPDA